MKCAMEGDVWSLLLEDLHYVIRAGGDILMPQSVSLLAIVYLLLR